jgi:hypothetical protein
MLRSDSLISKELGGSDSGESAYVFHAGLTTLRGCIGMNAFLKRLHRFNDDQLLGISEAIDLELERRLSQSDPIPESARQRANAREQSYRRDTGAAAAPIRVVGLRRLRTTT